MKRIPRKIISCTCGCGEQLEDRDIYGRPKKFINGHNKRKYTDPNEHKHIWRTKNKEAILEKERARKYALKLNCLNHYGAVCGCCGEAEIEFLTIDHIHGNGSQHRKETKGNSIYLILKRENYPNTYRVLCFNCNWSSYLGGGVCKHKRE